MVDEEGINGWEEWLEENRREWCRWVSENEESLERSGKTEEWDEEDDGDGVE